MTGTATGEPPAPERLDAVKRAVPDRPVLIASGVTPDNIRDYASADGFIVGTYFKKGGRTENAVDVARVRRLLAHLRRR